MPKRLLDVVSEDDLIILIEHKGMNYREAAEKINETYGTDFHRSTIGKHWRRIREEIEQENEQEHDQEEPESLEVIGVDEAKPGSEDVSKIHQMRKEIHKESGLGPELIKKKARGVFKRFRDWLARLIS